MKKLIYSLVIIFSCSLVLTGCTEEDVKPTDESLGVTGGSDDDRIKDK